MDGLLKLIEEGLKASPRNRQGLMVWNRMSREEKEKHAIELYKLHTSRQGTNWGHLPIELKMKCTDEMDFNSRLSLRATAHAERDIIDSYKINFTEVVFSNEERNSDSRFQNKGYGELTAKYHFPSNFSIVSNTSSSLETKNLKIYNKKMYFSAVHFLAYVLKVGKIDTFEIEETFSPGRFENCLNILEQSAPFHIKEFKVIAMKKPLVMFFMKHLAGGLETIYLNAENCKKFPFDEFLTFPVFVNAKLIKINKLYCWEAVSKLAEQWIINEAPIGHRIQIGGCSVLKIMDDFMVKFVDRIVTKTEKNLRIHTNSESKHILLNVIKKSYMDNYIYCSIIPSDLQESEYDQDDTWISELSRYRGNVGLTVSTCWDDSLERLVDQSIEKVNALLESMDFSAKELEMGTTSKWYGGW